MHPIILAAAIAQTFNLVCTGTMATEPFSYTYRLDMNAGKWCEGDCKFIYNFAAVRPTSIIFYDEPVTPVLGVGNKMAGVDRQTGAYTGVLTIQDRRLVPHSTQWTGRCEKAPFTGFPAPPETKF